MKNKTTKSNLSIGIGLLLLGGCVAHARPNAEPAGPDYPRYRSGRAAVTRPSSRRPLPEELKPRAREIARHGDPGRASRSAQEAARWAAQELYRASGRREYYRVGFYRGLADAMGDRFLGRPAFEQGERAGHRDPDARESGTLEGESAAESLAATRAARQVEAQYRDLSRDPRYLPRRGEPAYSAPPLELAEPRPEAVFADFPLASFAPSHARFSSYLAGWGFDAARLARCESHAEFFDNDWWDPSTAFAIWVDDPRRSSAYRRIRSEAERRRFRQLFDAELDRQMGILFAAHGQPSYDQGIDDGWSYGAFVHGELDFRRGYNGGFRRAFDEAAFDAFHRSYPTAYEWAYGHEFRQWADQPHPEIVEVRLVDGNRDGVFEPGEELLAEYELVNYGGRGRSFSVALEGSVLAQARLDTVELPARGTIRQERPLRARIEPSAEPRRRAQLQFRFAGQVEDLPLRVAYPLEFDRRSVRLHRDDLAGELRVELRVKNQSRRPVAGTVELVRAGHAGLRLTEPLGAVGAHASAVVGFRVSALDPLELMAGEIALDLRLEVAGATHDRWRHHVPDTVRNIGNRDLLRYMIQLAGRDELAGANVATARELMRMRLREDWKVAVIGLGNPYKHDYRKNTRETALGDLVRSYADERRSIVHPEVFDGLGAEVARLSDDLPGAHPFLRKYVRRLANRLP